MTTKKRKCDNCGKKVAKRDLANITYENDRMRVCNGCFVSL
jgi:ribosome-binding protein aMBF1 (putative translation factor)